MCSPLKAAEPFFELQKNEVKSLKSLRRAQNCTLGAYVQFTALRQAAASAALSAILYAGRAKPAPGESQPSRCRAARASLLLGLTVTARW
jgi:hypothetical protein